MFDLPTGSTSEKKAYAEFRKFLLGDGYQMEQFSVYTRVCMGAHNADTHMRRLRAALPIAGRVVALPLTEKQYEAREVLVGAPTASCNIDLGDQMTLIL